MGFSSRAGLGDKWVGRKQRGFSQDIYRVWKARFAMRALLVTCPHGRAGEENVRLIVPSPRSFGIMLFAWMSYDPAFFSTHSRPARRCCL